MSNDPEIKNLLGRALGEQEPPLRIDRDEVFRQGRKRLRNRRIFEAGGVVAGVVIAAVGAVTLTSLVDDAAEKLPPAASSSVEHPAPPGPTLPLTTTESPGVLPPSTSTTAGAPTSEPAVSYARAGELTSKLFDSGLVPADEVFTAPGTHGEPAFEVADEAYVFAADVRNAGGEGALLVSVGPAPPDAQAGCANLPKPFGNCEVSVVDGVHVALASWKSSTGEKRYLAHAARPDGSIVSAISTNLSERQRKSGQEPQQWAPVLDKSALGNLAALPGLSYR